MAKIRLQNYICIAAVAGPCPYSPVNIWTGIDPALIPLAILIWKENTEDYIRDKFQF